MTPFWRFFAVLVGPGVVLLLALVADTAAEIYSRGHCDTKFGCAGSFVFAAYIAGLASLCSSLAHLPACVVFRNAVRGVPVSWVVGVALVLGIGQCALFFGTDRLPSDFALLIGAWVGISAVLALAVLAVAHLRLRSNPVKPTLLRGAD